MFVHGLKGFGVASRGWIATYGCTLLGIAFLARPQQTSDRQTFSCNCSPPGRQPYCGYPRSAAHLWMSAICRPNPRGNAVSASSTFRRLRFLALARPERRSGLFLECSVSLLRAYEGLNPAHVDHCSRHLAVNMLIGESLTADKVKNAFWASRALIVVYRSVLEDWEAMAASPEGTPLLFPLLAYLDLHSTCTEVQFFTSADLRR